MPAQEARWNDLSSQVSELYQQGKYGEAIPIAIEAVKAAEEAFGPDDKRVAIGLNNLAVLYDDQGQYAEAEPLYQRALPIDEKALGPEHPNVATDLNNLAVLYVEEGKYAEAEPLYQRAIRIREKALGPDDPDVAGALGNLAQLYDQQGKFAEAEPLYQRVLLIYEKALGPDHLDVASTLNSQALLYEDEGKYAEAEPLYQRALLIYEKALGPDHPSVATTLSNLALLYDNRGRYIEAEPLYQRALRIDEKALGPDHPRVATVVNELAELYADEGRYAEAEPLHLRALRIREKALGPDHPGVATVLNDLALLYDEQGKYADAEPLYQRALSIREKALGPDSSAVAQTLSNFAVLYRHQGRYAEAENLYLRALRIHEKALGPDHMDVAADLNNLGVLYVDQDRYAEAEPLFQRALRIVEKAVGPEDHRGAAVLDNLAMLYTYQDKYVDAEPLYQRALRVREKALGPDHPEVALDLGNLAQVYMYEAKYAQAEPLLQRALSIDEKALGNEHNSVGSDVHVLAELNDAQGKYAEAAPLYQRSLDNLFQQFQYNFAYMTEKERLGFLDTLSSNFPVYFSFVHRFRDKDPQLIGSMYNLLLWEKGFVAGSVADLRRAVEASGDAEALSLLGQLTEKRTQIAALLNAKPPDLDLWRKQVGQLQTEANDVEKSLVARSSAFAEKRKLERATWQQLRDALQPGEAAVEFAHFRYYDKKWTDTSYYVALVVTRETKEQPEYIFLGTDEQIEGEALARFQQSTRTRGAQAEEETTLPGADAYELIWKPLETALARKTRIYLSPDGVLNQLPLGIIPAPDGKLLMERYDLRLLSSTRDILSSVPPRADATALLVGDPTFDLSEVQQLAAMQKLTLPQQQPPVLMAALSPGDRSRDLGNGTTLPRLPGTGAEVHAIAELMQEHQWKTNVYTNELALKRVVEQASSPRVVHLATHGFFLPDQQIHTNQVGLGENQPSGLEDPMLRSGLYFAGANRTLAGKTAAQGLDNGVLTAMEAGNLNLRGTELVVLSACNTGQGDVKNGEGVFGLRRALQEAGAQEVLMSLWSVPDQETLDLMKLFYAKWLAGMEIHEALKEAQLEMREQVKKSHDGKDLPYYWGAFVLVGR
ncbi:MAG: CHAT domain-containing tetratricopeptide repeat protein [Acidobacteriaceae bacterium]